LLNQTKRNPAQFIGRLWLIPVIRAGQSKYSLQAPEANPKQVQMSWNERRKMIQKTKEIGPTTLKQSHPKGKLNTS